MRSAEVDPTDLPELVQILRHGWQAKVRMFDVACADNHRLVDVLKVSQRPVAVGFDTTPLHSDPDRSERWWRWAPSKSGGGTFDRRARLLVLWLDVSFEIVSVATGKPVQDRYTFTSARGKCSEPISLPWLRGLVESGQRRRVIINSKTR